MSLYLATGGSGTGGSGTVTSITAGTGITLSPSTITVSGSVGISNNTANTLAGFNNSGVFSDVAIGTGLTLSAGTLAATGGGSGTVTSFSAGNLSPLFTSSVATATTTPALTFSLTNAAAGTLFGNFTGSSGAPSFTAPGTADQVLGVAHTGGGLEYKTITAGTNITVTPTAGVITIAATGGGTGLTWNTVTTTTQTAAINNGYITNNAALVTVTLPTTAAVGSIVYVAGQGAGGWKIAQSSGQTVNFGNVVTTSGATGFLSSTNQFDVVQLLCITANTQFTVLSSVGNITFN